MRVSEKCLRRLEILLEWWGLECEPGEAADDALMRALDAAVDPLRAWESLAVLRVEIPTSHEARRFARAVQLGGARAAISSLPEPAMATVFGDMAEVSIMKEPVLVDVHDTARTDRTTGIQRVVRETVRRWETEQSVTPIAWDAERRCIRLLTEDEARGLHGSGFDASSAANIPPYTYVVPLGGRFIVSELAAEAWRTPLHQSIAEHSTTRLSAIGYDLVPVMSSETASFGIVAHFPRYLDALASAERITTISAAAAIEYEGWKRMLVGSGRPGPHIEPIPLAADVVTPTAADLSDAGESFGHDDEGPLVLVVGSHEPRKNHLAILHAARGLWEEGLAFRLAMVGGNAWGHDEFLKIVERLQESGRPLQVRSKVTDGFLAACYRIASFSLFPSLNEGFGLPVLESLTAGTPVITSNFGSMREIGEAHGGVLMVDPRDEDALRDAMRALLTDPDRLAALRVEAGAVRPKSWDRYAAETLAYLTA